MGIQKLISQYLSTNGDGTGTTNAVGSYSVGSPGKFYITPPAAEDYFITRMIVTVEDTTGFAAAEYGNLGAALTNGVLVQISSDTKTTQSLTPAPVTTNALWGSFCYDVQLKSFGVGNEFLLVRWTFDRSGMPVFLQGSENAELSVICQDDLSGLDVHRFLVQGYNDSIGQ